MLDDLMRKYAGKRVEKYINSEEEQLAIGWFCKKVELGPHISNWITQELGIQLLILLTRT